MKSVLVADDERPVIEGISLIVRRELAGEFAIVGTAASGREAIERSAALAPDIVLMDVRMPGVSGLEAVRELRKRGSASVFVLVTAYERFDIAREAVELGVLDYLLKPVTKEKLAAALRSAASFIDRRLELERGEIDHREREERSRAFAETALLEAVMLGADLGPELGRCRAALGIDEPMAAAGVLAFAPARGRTDPGAGAGTLIEELRATIRYKTDALVGPPVSGLALVLLPLREESGAGEAIEALRSAIAQAHGEELGRGRIRLAFGGPKPFARASSSWSEALASLFRDDAGPEAGGPGYHAAPPPYEDEEAFLRELFEGSPERARLSLGRIAPAACGEPGPPTAERYRMAVLFGAAYRGLARRGLLDPGAASGMMDFEDLRSAGGAAFGLALEARFAALSAAMGRAPRRSPIVERAMEYVDERYGSQITLESAAEEVGISPSRLSRLVVEETGRGFSDHLIERRIERAKELLSLPGASIKQVSAACGYPDPNYFSRLFKRMTGLTPTGYSAGSPEVPDEEE